jgi:hypothetical protein
MSPLAARVHIIVLLHFFSSPISKVYIPLTFHFKSCRWPYELNLTTISVVITLIKVWLHKQPLASNFVDLLQSRKKNTVVVDIVVAIFPV